MKANNKGLFQKYVVRRSDGRDGQGEKHANCQYFVLDIDHDPYAVAALRAYVDACHREYPMLAHDLEIIAADTEREANG